MSLDLLPTDPLIAARAACDTAVIDAAAQVARYSAARLTGLVARAGGSATAARWSAPSARAFAERADELRALLARAEAAADDTVAALGRARAEAGTGP